MMAVRQKPGVLYIDHEGGWGGSSRSLYFLIENLTRRDFSPAVASRKPGPIEARFAALDVPHLVIPGMPPFRPAQRKNLVAFALFLLGLRRFPGLLSQFRRLVEQHGIQLIHANHESISLFALLLARCLGLPCVCHIRALLLPGVFARLVYGSINRWADQIIFITDHNRDYFAALVGARFEPRKAEVVHNIAPRFDLDAGPPTEQLGPPDKLRVLSLSNFSPNRGVDRIVDVACALRERGREDHVFWLFGYLANKRLMPGVSNRYLDEIVARVRHESLEHMIRFPGHTGEPERALLGCDVLIRLPRLLPSPWGRDIIEAMAVGVPVVTVGDVPGFVEHGVTGYVDRDYDPERIAEHLIRLRDDPALRSAMSARARAKAAQLFDGAMRARDVEAIYRRVLASA